MSKFPSILLGFPRPIHKREYRELIASAINGGLQKAKILPYNAAIEPTWPAILPKLHIAVGKKIRHGRYLTTLLIAM